MGKIFSYCSLTELMSVICRLCQRVRDLLVTSSDLNQPRKLKVLGEPGKFSNFDNFDYVIRLANHEISLQLSDKLSDFFLGLLLKTVKNCAGSKDNRLKLNVSVSDTQLLKKDFSSIFSKKYQSLYGKLSVYTEEEYFKPIKEIQKFKFFSILESKKAFGREIDGQNFDSVTHLQCPECESFSEIGQRSKEEYFPLGPDKYTTKFNRGINCLDGFRNLITLKLSGGLADSYLNFENLKQLQEVDIRLHNDYGLDSLLTNLIVSENGLKRLDILYKGNICRDYILLHGHNNQNKIQQFTVKDLYTIIFQQEDQHKQLYFNTNLDQKISFEVNPKNLFKKLLPSYAAESQQIVSMEFEYSRENHCIVYTAKNGTTSKIEFESFLVEGAMQINSHKEF